MAELFLEKYILDNIFRENNWFPKIVPFMKKRGILWWSQRDHRKSNMTHTCWMLDKQGYTLAHLYTRPLLQAPTLPLPTHRRKYIIVIAFFDNFFFCERVLMLRTFRVFFWLLANISGWLVGSIIRV